jgi:hypothetical protein
VTGIGPAHRPAADYLELERHGQIRLVTQRS